ncbi:hypothetical protein [Streptacidiphilus jiangxiensis]|uniref:hypothetical protein n=1 Tax=Streptacidiphilus jiangxiensis TaxID=235985 RepID=UPI0005A975FB|nr:hypothetical protein [Streptacidiphilus jiangxiensis]
MSRRGRAARRLVVGEETYLWQVGHDHRRVDDVATGRHRFLDCREVLTIRRAGTEARLRLVFAAGPGRLVSDGLLPSGALGADGAWLNLHEPGAVRALLEQATARGWRFEGHQATDVDGWPLFGAVVDLRNG